jgi:hypothetical protein
MRKSFWIGLVLLVVGLIVALSGAATDDRTDIDVGSDGVTVQHSEGVPSWLGWTAAGIGLVLMVAGLRGRGEPVRRFDEHRPHTP